MINRDRIYIEDLRVEGIIGIFDWEKETKQEISISYEIDQDNLTAANADKIEAATDYKSINKAIIAFVENNKFELIGDTDTLDLDPRSFTSRLDTVELEILSEKKTKEITWSELKPMIISHINHYFENTKEPILKKTSLANKKNDISNDETVKKIVEVLDSKIRPAVARDGGDIKFKSFENGVVKVELQGSCSGCPSSLMTLKQGVQNLLKHYVKEVNSVEAN